MASESTRRRKLTQTVTDHILINADFDEVLAVVNLENVPYEFGHDLAGPGPGADGGTGALIFLFQDLLNKLHINIWTFFL